MNGLNESSRTCGTGLSQRSAILGGLFLLLFLTGRLLGFDQRIVAELHQHAEVDKMVHFLFFGILSAWGCFLVPRILSDWVPVGCLIVMGLGLLDELSQIWVAERDFDTLDLAANLFGAGSFGLTVTLMRSGRFKGWGVQVQGNGQGKAGYGDKDFPDGRWDGLSAVAWNRRRSKSLSCQARSRPVQGRESKARTPQRG